MLQRSETGRYRMKLNIDRHNLESEGNQSHRLLLCKKPERYLITAEIWAFMLSRK